MLCGLAWEKYLSSALGVCEVVLMRFWMSGVIVN